MAPKEVSDKAYSNLLMCANFANTTPLFLLGIVDVIRYHTAPCYALAIAGLLGSTVYKCITIDLNSQGLRREAMAYIGAMEGYTLKQKQLSEYIGIDGESFLEQIADGVARSMGSLAKNRYKSFLKSAKIYEYDNSVTSLLSAGNNAALRIPIPNAIIDEYGDSWIFVSTSRAGVALTRFLVLHEIGHIASFTPLYNKVQHTYSAPGLLSVLIMFPVFMNWNCMSVLTYVVFLLWYIDQSSPSNFYLRSSGLLYGETVADYFAVSNLTVPERESMGRMIKNSRFTLNDCHLTANQNHIRKLRLLDYIAGKHLDKEDSRYFNEFGILPRFALTIAICMSTHAPTYLFALLYWILFFILCYFYYLSRRRVLELDASIEEILADKQDNGKNIEDSFGAGV